MPTNTREMILLGAGASVEAGIPSAFKMTEEMLDTFQKTPFHKTESRVLAFVIGGLLFKRGIEGEDALSSGINVEELFNAVLLLAERNFLEASPFIASWHSMVEELDTLDPPKASLDDIQRGFQKAIAKLIQSSIPTYVPGFSLSEIDKSVHQVVSKMAKGQMVNIGGLGSLSRATKNYLEDFIKQWTDKIKNTSVINTELNRELKIFGDNKPRRGQGRVFKSVAEQMIMTLIDIVWIEDPTRITYLLPLIEFSLKQNGLVIATLNYDNSIELASATAGVLCDTGITSWSQNSRFNYQSTGITLLKLHGSIEWEQKKLSEPNKLEHLAVKSIDLSNKENRSNYRPAVIFGHRNKLTAEGPFLDLMHFFIQSLENANLLTVIGYSFGDPHINELIARWMNGEDSRRLRIVNKSHNKIKTNFINNLSRLPSSRIEIIQEEAGTAISKLYRDCPN